MWTFTRRPELKVPVLGWGVFLQGVGFAVAGAGADACAAYGQGSTGGVLLLYLGLTLFVGVAEGLLELIVSFGNFLLVATMGWLERRAVAAEQVAERA